MCATTAAIVFIVQHLFDEAQIIADNVGPPVTRQQWQYLYRLGLDVRNSLSNVSLVTDCISRLFFWFLLPSEILEKKKTKIYP